MTSSAPISSVVCSRYAGALVDLAEASKSVAKVQKDLEALDALVSESSDFAHLVFSPLMSKEKQGQVVSEIASKSKFHDLTQKFLGVLVQNRRLNTLQGVVTAYKRIVSARSGEVTARVETAVPMTAAQEKEVAKKISAVIGRDVAVSAVVDPEILGGMIVTIGSSMIDDSVRRKLERLGGALKSNSNENSVPNLKEVV